LHTGVWYRVLHHISHNFQCVTSVICMCHVASRASWKAKYDVYAQMPKCSWPQPWDLANAFEKFMLHHWLRPGATVGSTIMTKVMFLQFCNFQYPEFHVTLLPLNKIC
jgi:hypothetical protein